MDEHGVFKPDFLPTGMRVDVPRHVPSDLIIEDCLDIDGIGRKYQKHFGTTRYVLIDLSGTLHIEDKATPDAVDALKRLRETGVIVRFVTNTTKESKRLLYERLRSLGFELDKDEIFTSLIAARQKIEELKIRPYFLVEEDALEDFEGIDTENPSGVVVGLSPTNFDYTGLNKAFRLLFHGCPLIAIHKGKYYRKEDGLSLGPGPFVQLLSYATGSDPIVVGKPNPEFFKSAVNEDISIVSPTDIIMIGDDVDDDVLGAIDAGYFGILVKTGKYQNGDEYKRAPKFPTLVVDNFSKAVDVITSAMATEKGLSLKVVPDKEEMLAKKQKK